MSSKIKIAGLFFLFAAALWVTNDLLSCHDLACFKENDAWFKSRYDPKVPLYLTVDNGQDILKSIRDNQVRSATEDMITLLGKRFANNISPAADSTNVTCAVIGNSSNVIGSHYGPIIDAHTLVFRQNSAPIVGHESDVGTHTDYNLLNELQPDLGSYRAPSKNILFFNIIRRKKDKLGRKRDYQIRFIERLENLAQQIHPEITLPAVDSNWGMFNLEIGANIQKNLNILHPEFIYYVNDHWFQSDIGFPSNGFSAIILALHLCNKVDVFGYDTLGTSNKYWRHYYNGSGANYMHNPEYQKEFLDELDKRGIIKLYPGVMNSWWRRVMGWFGSDR